MNGYFDISTLGSLNNRSVYYINSLPDVQDIGSINLASSLLLVIADKAQEHQVQLLAEKCANQSILYVCGSGGMASGIDTAFDIAIINKTFATKEGPSNSGSFNHSPITSFEDRVDEGLWFAAFSATHPTNTIENILVLNLTSKQYIFELKALIAKMEQGWMPSE